MTMSLPKNGKVDLQSFALFPAFVALVWGSTGTESHTVIKFAMVLMLVRFPTRYDLNDHFKAGH
jgi:hypothetical protein